MKNLLLMCLLLPVPLFAQTQNKEPDTLPGDFFERQAQPVKVLASVQLQVEDESTDSDDALKNQVESIFSRELRSLADIRVMDYNARKRADYLILVRVATFGIKNPRKDYYTLAYIVMDLKTRVIEPFSLVAGLSSEIPRDCRQIVADFDVRTLKPLREALK